jgi:O-antigen ligase
LILAAWAAALCVICILGILQYFGLDFFQSMAGRLLIIPAKYHFMASALDFNFPRYSIYSTLYNPNNVASMMTLAFPFATTCFVLSRSRRRQLAFGLLAGLFCLTLLGSNGRSGWVAVLLALIPLVALSIWRGITGWWKRLVILALVALLGYGTFNFVSSGNLGKRADQPMAEVKKVLKNATDQGVAGEALTQPGTQETLAEQLIRKYGHMASGRGYIWIRSLQMAANTMLLGRGPDTFALYFPNTDPYKIFYTQPEVFIDKPHNLYLQLWLNLGGLAALAFLVMVIFHAVHTFKILKQADLADERTMLALGLFLGWFAYILAAFFYDSAISVAPAFWIVFGLGMAVNEMLIKEIACKKYAQYEIL